MEEKKEPIAPEITEFFAVTYKVPIKALEKLIEIYKTPQNYFKMHNPFMGAVISKDHTIASEIRNDHYPDTLINNLLSNAIDLEYTALKAYEKLQSILNARNTEQETGKDKGNCV